MRWWKKMLKMAKKQEGKKQRTCHSLFSLFFFWCLTCQMIYEKRFSDFLVPSTGLLFRQLAKALQLFFFWTLAFVGTCKVTHRSPISTIQTMFTNFWHFFLSRSLVGFLFFLLLRCPFCFSVIFVFLFYFFEFLYKWRLL